MPHNSQDHSSDAVASQLTGRQLLTAAVLGVAFWLLGVLLIRYGAQAGLLNGLPRIGTFALIIAVTWPGIGLVKRLACRQPAQLLPTVLVATTAALACDVTALTLVPGLYAEDPSGVVAGVIVILWGVGAALALAVLRAGRVWVPHRIGLGEGRG